MAHRFLRSEQAVEGLVYLGASFLIVVIGLRGVRVLEAEQKIPILLAIGVEFIMLVMFSILLMRSSRVVEGLVYSGASILIVVIGLRGIRVLGAEDTTWILAAIVLESSILVLFSILLMRSKKVVEGLVYCGASFLIMVVGLRGIRVLGAEDTTWILAAIVLESSMLLILAIHHIRKALRGEQTYLKSLESVSRK
jgi:hypothetical protein